MPSNTPFSPTAAPNHKPGWSKTPPLHKLLFALALCVALFLGTGIGSSFTGVIHKVLSVVR